MSLAASNPNWLELPSDVTAAILHRIGAVEILKSAQKVCSTWRKICKDPSVWRSIDILNKGDKRDLDSLEETANLIKVAVDRSCGQLVDLSIQFFATDDLLHHIADRASQLRRLHLACGYKLLNLAGAAKKLPLLEELEIYGLLSAEDLGNIGRSCPKLETLKYNNRKLKPKYDGEALAIAETMSGLRHLQLLKNGLTDIGLETILNGCPKLESLDLRRCKSVHLQGSLKKRCSEQIKDLRRPEDVLTAEEYALPDMYFNKRNIYPPENDGFEYSDEDDDLDYMEYLMWG